MDTWLDADDIQQLILQLNPDLKTGREYDANWEKLRRERPDPFARVVKTQSPTLLLFDRHASFVYKRFDGAQWHTELRDIDLEYRKRGLNSQQAKLKDAMDTLLASQNSIIRLQWITPVDKKTNNFDPRYQLIRSCDAWYCWINGAVYAESRRRQQPNKNYIEVTFSTRIDPVFDLETIESKLDLLYR